MKNFAELDSPLGKALVFQQLSAQESLSTPYTFSITALSDRADIDFKKLLGQHVTVRMRMPPDVQEEPRYFDGIVEQVSLIGHTGSKYQYLLQARPAFWFLSQTQDCRIFQDKTVVEILKKVLEDHPFVALDCERLTASYTPWVYCVQYRESDFLFLSRLMEQEGIYYYFTHAAGKHTMVLCDSVSASRACKACTPLPVRKADTVQATGKTAVWDLVAMQRVQPGASVITDFDFTRTQVSLVQSSSLPQAHTLGDLEVFDYPGLYDKEGDGRQFVQSRMEELACATQQTSGKSNAPALLCGGLFNVSGSLRESDDIEYLITSTQIQVAQPEGDAAGQTLDAGFSCGLTALDSAVPYRSPPKTGKPIMQGPQTAMVVGPAGEEIFTDKYGRVKVQFHWDRYGNKDEKSSCWMRVSQPWAGQGWGGVSIPRIGQEVIVDFLEGDPDQPLIVGRVYNAQSMPPYALPASGVISGMKTKTHKGTGYNEMSMNDTAGKEMITIHGQYDMGTTVLHDQTSTVHNDKTNTVNNKFTETIKSDAKITITAGTYSHDVAANTATYHVQAALTETYDATQTTKVKSDLTISSTTGAIKVTSDAQNIDVTAATSITLKVGASMIKMEANGNIEISGVNVSIKGSTDVTTKGGTVHSVADSQHETKGAIVLSDGSATNTVKGGMVMLNP